MGKTTLQSSMDLLWTNSSPTASFSAGTVGIPSVADYSWFIITLREHTSTANFFTVMIKGDGTYFNSFYASDTLQYRKIMTNSTGIYFDNAIFVSSYAHTNTDNARNIPQKIYGIK